MFEAVTNLIKASKPIQFALVFIAGGAVAAVFYPTKQIKETLTKTFQSQITTLNQQHSQELSTQQSKYDAQTQTLTQTNQTLNSKVTELNTQVLTLQSHEKTTYYKIVHPDGTVEERASSEEDSSEEQSVSQEVQAEYQTQLQTEVSKLETIQATQVSALQKTWDAKEQSYQSQISTLTSTKTVTTNPKNFTLDVGGLTSGDYYGHVTYDIFGPFILGLQAQFGASSAAGAGLGLRF